MDDIGAPVATAKRYRRPKRGAERICDVLAGIIAWGFRRRGDDDTDSSHPQ